MSIWLTQGLAASRSHFVGCQRQSPWVGDTRFHWRVVPWADPSGAGAKWWLWAHGSSKWPKPTPTSVPLWTMGMMKILSSLTEVQEDGTNPRTMLSRQLAAVLAMFVTILTLSPIFTCSLGSFLAHLSEMSLVWSASHNSMFRSGLF